MNVEIGNGAARLLLGDCLERLRELPDASVDSVVCDPPYGLSDHSLADTMDCLRAWLDGKEYRPKKKGFMGRSWDAWVPGPEVWRECLRVLKPGGHLLAFAGTRSMDLMSMAVRLAGFELRDSVGYANDGGDPLQAGVMAWCYGSGFPKSMNVGKQLEKVPLEDTPDWIECQDDRDAWLAEWSGWGTALKPAWEPIVLARKPLGGRTVAENVLQHGAGALNIDGCRVPTDDKLGGGGQSVSTKVKAEGWDRPWMQDEHAKAAHAARVNANVAKAEALGRWPANLITDGSPEVVALFPNSAGAGGSIPNVKVTGYGGGIGTGDSAYLGGDRTKVDSGSGSAARFFYCAKASKRDRDEGLEGFEQKRGGAEQFDSRWKEGTGELRQPTRANHHPTVKPTELMAYLCRLVTPPGGVVLDPFMGSGSTGKAAMREGFRFIGCELSPEYLAIARARIEHAWREANPEPAPVQEPEAGDQLPLFA